MQRWKSSPEIRLQPVSSLRNLQRACREDGSPASPAVDLDRRLFLCRDRRWLGVRVS